MRTGLKKPPQFPPSRNGFCPAKPFGLADARLIEMTTPKAPFIRQRSDPIRKGRATEFIGSMEIL
jgi:hypothetical protein